MTEQKERTVNDIIQETGHMSCPVQKAAYVVDAFLKELMCGRCFPCALGTCEASIILRNMISGQATDIDNEALRRIADAMSFGSRCKKGRDIARFMYECMNDPALLEHIRGRCPAHECTAYVEYRIIPEKCTMCGECQAICAYHAVIGERKVPYLSGYLPFEIVLRRCTRCGECLKVCPNDAIIVVDKRDSIEVGVS